MEWKKSNAGNTVREVVDYYSKGKSGEFLAPGAGYYIPNLWTFASWLRYYRELGVPVTIVGDYDADGVCSSAEMTVLLRDLGFKNVKVRLPKRLSEGYGLSEKIIDEISSGVIITLDNGIKAISQIEKAKQKGLVVMVMDHHQPEYRDGEISLPKADLIVDPHIPKELILKEVPPEGCPEYREYCAAGLVCRLAGIMQCSEYAYNKISAMAAIATIADVVELTGDNRNIYHYGVRQIAEGNITCGLAAIIKRLKTDRIVTEDEIGFQVAPLLNAPGRIKDDGAKDSYSLLVCDDMEQATVLSNVVAAFNESRKGQKKEAWERARAMIEAEGLADDNPVIVVDEETGEGIVGLVASEISEKYETTSIVFTKKDGCYKGSARAHDSASIIHALDEVYARHPEYFIGYGGHKGAAGVTIREDSLDGFKSCIQEVMGARPPKKDILEYDLEITVEQIPQVLNELKKFAPYGNGNKAPVFLIKQFRVSFTDTAFQAVGENGIKIHGNNCCAVSFSMKDRYLKDKMPITMDIVGHLGEKRYMKYVTNQIEILDYRVPEKEKNTLECMIESILSSSGLA